MPLSAYGPGFMPSSTFESTYGTQFFNPMNQTGGFDFMGNLRGMGPLQMIGTAYGLGDVGYNLFTPNQDLYWGPRALTTAGEGALTGWSLSGGNPIGAIIGGLGGYMGGKY